MNIGIWLTYDLGDGKDYDNMYKWLSQHNAVECGTNVAFIKSYPWAITDIATSKSKLLDSIRKTVKLGKEDRLYIVYPKKKNDKTVYSGGFIYGQRKKINPWD